MSRAPIAPILSASLHYIPGRAGTRRNAQRELLALRYLHRSAEWLAHLIDLVRAVNRVNEASGLPRGLRSPRQQEEPMSYGKDPTHFCHLHGPHWGATMSKTRVDPLTGAPGEEPSP